MKRTVTMRAPITNIKYPNVPNGESNIPNDKNMDRYIGRAINPRNRTARNGFDNKKDSGSRNSQQKDAYIWQ